MSLNVCITIIEKLDKNVSENTFQIIYDEWIKKGKDEYYALKKVSETRLKFAQKYLFASKLAEISNINNYQTEITKWFQKSS